MKVVMNLTDMAVVAFALGGGVAGLVMLGLWALADIGPPETEWSKGRSDPKAQESSAAVAKRSVRQRRERNENAHDPSIHCHAKHDA